MAFTPYELAGSLLRLPLPSDEVVKTLLELRGVAAHAPYDTKISPPMATEDAWSLASKDPDVALLLARSTDDPALLERLAELDPEIRLKVLENKACPQSVYDAWHDWVVGGFEGLPYAGDKRNGIKSTTVANASVQVCMAFISSMEPKWIVHRYPLHSLLYKLAIELSGGKTDALITLLEQLPEHDHIDAMRTVGSGLARRYNYQEELGPFDHVKAIDGLRRLQGVAPFAATTIISSYTAAISQITAEVLEVLEATITDPEDLQHHRDRMIAAARNPSRLPAHLAFNHIRSIPLDLVDRFLALGQEASAVLANILQENASPEIVERLLLTGDPAVALSALISAPEMIPASMLEETIYKGLSPEAAERRQALCRGSYTSFQVKRLMEREDLDVSIEALLFLMRRETSPDVASSFISGAFPRKPRPGEARRVAEEIMIPQHATSVHYGSVIRSIALHASEQPWIDEFIDALGPDVIEYLRQEMIAKYINARFTREFGGNGRMWVDALFLLDRGKVPIWKVANTVRAMHQP